MCMMYTHYVVEHTKIVLLSNHTGSLCADLLLYVCSAAGRYVSGGDCGACLHLVLGT